MYKRLLPALVLGQLGLVAGTALAAEEAVGEAVVEPAQPAAPAPQGAAPPPGATPAPPGQPYYYNGPVYVVPAYPQPLAQPPLAQPPQPPPEQVPSALPPPPVFQPPAPAATSYPVPPRPVRAFPYRLGISGHGGMLWTNQELYRDNLLMSGGGIDLRLRLSDHLAINGVFDVFKTDLGDGNYSRASYPIQVGLMYYLLPVRDRIDFNVFTVASVGLVPSTIGLAVALPAEQQLRTTEALGSVGVGFDMRFGRLSILADMRAIALWRLGDPADVTPLPIERIDGGSGLKQLAVPDSSYGWIFNMGAMIWL